jgi:hypothetical protein
MEVEVCEFKCEIKCCKICSKFIEYNNNIIIIKYEHYHKDCIVELYLNARSLLSYLS